MPEIEIVPVPTGRTERERERGKWWWCGGEGRGDWLPHPGQTCWMVEVGQPAGSRQPGIARP